MSNMQSYWIFEVKSYPNENSDLTEGGLQLSDKLSW